jgi:hypothetical protein
MRGQICVWTTGTPLIQSCFLNIFFKLQKCQVRPIYISAFVKQTKYYETSIQSNMPRIANSQLFCCWPNSILIDHHTKITQLAQNILRTICFLELGVLWLFCIQPSHNILGMVQAFGTFSTFNKLECIGQYIHNATCINATCNNFKDLTVYIRKSVNWHHFPHAARYHFPHAARHLLRITLIRL